MVAAALLALPSQQGTGVSAEVAMAEPGSVKGRHAHWVLRTSNLQRSLDFYRSVFGMKVLRHEENGEACPITCNGEFNTAWSKTMVGYETEDIAYALELTFNYGVTSYPKGEALRDIALRVKQPLLDALGAAGKLGYGPAESNGTSMHLTGPDGYRYVLIPQPLEGEDVEPFHHIRLRVRSLHTSVAFYTRMLGMSELTKAAYKRAQPTFEYMKGVRVVGYALPGSGWSSVPLFLEESLDSQPVRVEQWEGRHALALPASELRAAYARIQAVRPEAVVHELRELKEKLGTLLLAIVKDPDGLEICLVSSEVFDAASREADDFAEPDWALRGELAAARSVSLETSDPAAKNRPEFSFEDVMRENPEAFAKAEDEVRDMLEKAERTLQSNEDLMKAAQEAVDSGDVEKMKAIDWEKLEAGKREMEAWMNRHKPTDPEEKKKMADAMRMAGALPEEAQEALKRAQEQEAREERERNVVGDHDEL